MISKITASCLMVGFALLTLGVQAQQETFYYDTGSGRRAGMSSLTIQPDYDTGRSHIKFTTKQSGVSHTNKFRFAIQWISSPDKEEFNTWNAAVFQLRVPQGGGSESPAIEQILRGTYYDRYVRAGNIWNNDQYVDLVLVDRDQQVTADTTNQYRGQEDGANFKVTNSRVVVGTETLVELEFSAPLLDPVGQNQIWFKWLFYNDDVFCDISRFDNYCFATAPIDGKKDGYTYTTYIAWKDYYNKDVVMIYLWILFALSLFWLLGDPWMSLVDFLLQCYYLYAEIVGWVGGNNHPFFEAYGGDVLIMFFWTHSLTWLITQVMKTAKNFPILGPIINLVLILVIDTYITNLSAN